MEENKENVIIAKCYWPKQEQIVCYYKDKEIYLYSPNYNGLFIFEEFYTPIKYNSMTCNTVKFVGIKTLDIIYYYDVFETLLKIQIYFDGFYYILTSEAEAKLSLFLNKFADQKKF